MGKIKIGIVGYGNLGRGVHKALSQNPDIECMGVFTRRSPETVELIHHDIKAYSMEEILSFKGKIDVLILCGGSASDLPVMAPSLACDFNIVDSFDNHSQIPKHFENVDINARLNKTVAIISAGWDPGLFSLNRLIGESVLPNGTTNTFWGTGVSQGHSDAIRRLDGVKSAIQYTVPVEETVKLVRSGSEKNFSPRERHLRRCYVVLKEGVDGEKVKHAIVTMPAYFSDYDTEVNFISQEEFNENHQKMPHGGFVIRHGRTGENEENNQLLEFSLKLDSNPEFTSSILLAFARAAYRISALGDFGAKTIFDIPLSYLSPKKHEDLLKNLL